MSTGQLRLGLRRFDQLGPVAPPIGYALRTYRPGDEAAWIDLLSTGEFGDWDRDRLDRMLAGERAPLPRDGIFFVTHDDQPVAAACIFFHQSDQREVAELGWVVVHPDHRGRGLGRSICTTALNYAYDLGHRYVYLKTEAFRTAALAMYRRLGFEVEETY